MEYLDAEIRARLGRYLRGEHTLDEFREWFTPATWDVHLSGNESAANLAHRIEHVIAEYLTENITRGTLNTRLCPLQETYVTSYGDLQSDLRTQLTAAVKRPRFSGVGTQS